MKTARYHIVSRTSYGLEKFLESLFKISKRRQQEVCAQDTVVLSSRGWRNMCTIELSVGRGTGQTYALHKFANAHPELKILIIYPTSDHFNMARQYHLGSPSRVRHLKVVEHITYTTVSEVNLHHLNGYTFNCIMLDGASQMSERCLNNVLELGDVSMYHEPLRYSFLIG